MMGLPTWVYICAGVWFSLDITLFALAFGRTSRDANTIKELEAEMKRIRGF